MLAAAARARAAGAEVVVASLHCCLEYEHDPTEAQVAAVRALLASPDVDLVLGHHAHVVQPFERIDGEWVAYGLGNHIAEHSTRGYPTEDSVMARFTFTRGDDGRFTVTTRGGGAAARSSSARTRCRCCPPTRRRFGAGRRRARPAGGRGRRAGHRPRADRAGRALGSGA